VVPVEYITTKEAGNRIGLSDSQIRSLIKAGKIRAVKLGHDWLVVADLLDYRRRRKPKTMKGERRRELSEGPKPNR
jgi:excisionase family DNA binding protein